MDWLGKLFGGATGNIISSVGDVADKFIETKEEKKRFKLELEALLQRRDSEMEQTLRAELQAKERVLVAELQQGDKYTKRARPSVVYFGLAIIFFNYCFVPLMQYLGDTAIQDIQPFNLPEYFWIAWGGIVGTWSVGRSAERLGYRNRVTSFVTGNPTAPPKLVAPGGELVKVAKG